MSRIVFDVMSTTIHILQHPKHRINPQMLGSEYTLGYMIAGCLDMCIVYVVLRGLGYMRCNSGLRSNTAMTTSFINTMCYFHYYKTLDFFCVL